jgi:hypothetical protein
MLIFETENPRPRKKKRKNLIKDPPVGIIDQIKALKKVKINYDPEGDLDELNPNPRIVEMTPDAIDILEEFDDYIEDYRDELEQQNKVESTYSRTVQLAEQIALILSIGKNIDNPVIDDNSIVYGISLAKFLSDRMLYIVNNYIASNEYEHEIKRIYQIIRNSERIKKSELTRKTQNLQRHTRDDIIATLIESNQVTEWLDANTNTRYLTAKEEKK